MSSVLNLNPLLFLTPRPKRPPYLNTGLANPGYNPFGKIARPNLFDLFRLMSLRNTRVKTLTPEQLEARQETKEKISDLHEKYTSLNTIADQVIKTPNAGVDTLRNWVIQLTNAIFPQSGTAYEGYSIVSRVGGNYFNFLTQGGYARQWLAACGGDIKPEDFTDIPDFKVTPEAVNGFLNHHHVANCAMLWAIKQIWALENKAEETGIKTSDNDLKDLVSLREKLVHIVNVSGAAYLIGQAG